MATKDEILAVSESRAMLYRVLSELYFKPLAEEQIEAFATQDFALLAESSCPLAAEGFSDMRRHLRRRHTGTRQELAMDFTQCFLGARTYRGMTAAPYETLYRDPSGVLMGPIRHEVFSFYKQERVSLAEGVDYADDHLSFELEFMAVLCERFSRVIEADETHEALRILAVQERFLNEHLLLWIPRFCNLATKFLETRFYRGVLKITRGFLFDDVEVVADMRDAIERGFDQAEESAVAAAEVAA